MTNQPRPSIFRPPPREDVESPARAAEAYALKRRYYSKFDLHSFERKLEKFWKSDLTDPGFDISDAVNEVLRPHPYPGYTLTPYNWDEIPVGETLWRARKMTDEMRAGVVTTVDLWEPPRDKASQGRFNVAEDPLLYGCIGTPIDTLSEARISTPGTPFILICYQVVQPIFARRVGITHDPDLTPRQQRIEERVTEFLAQVVSLPALALGRETYEHTNRILNEFFRLEPGHESGWKYMSTMEHSSALNVALQPQKAHLALKVRSVMAGLVHETPPGHPGRHDLSFGSHSDGMPDAVGNLTLVNFPHDRMSSLDDYFDLAIRQ